MQPVFSSLSSLDFLQYEYRADLQILVGRWLRQPTEDELHQGYFQLLEVAETHGACYWFIDARRRAHANQQSTPWMMEKFLPLLPQHLGEPVFIAYLFMPNHLYEIEHDASVPPLTYFDHRPYHIERFTDEHGAMEWLAAKQRVARVAS
jgi:hypothetical protein